MAQSVYNWTGFYLGGTAGGGIANSSHLGPGLHFDCTNTKFQEGFGTVGLTAGYNWQFGHTVLGIEGDYNWANVDKTKAYRRMTIRRRQHDTVQDGANSRPAWSRRSRA